MIGSRQELREMATTPVGDIELHLLFDYVKIRFPTLDIQHIIKNMLKLNINYMLHEDYGRYSYTAVSYTHLLYLPCCHQFQSDRQYFHTRSKSEAGCNFEKQTQHFYV